MEIGWSQQREDLGARARRLDKVGEGVEEVAEVFLQLALIEHTHACIHSFTSMSASVRAHLSIDRSIHTHT